MQSTMQEQLLQYPVQISLPVQWGEMDSFDHVNNIVYFRYFESVRIAYFQEMQIIGEHAQPIAPILGATSCKFVYPLTFPDTVRVGASISSVAEDRFVMEYAVFSQRHQRLAAKGSGRIVSYNYETKAKVLLPETWKAAIARIEGSG